MSDKGKANRNERGLSVSDLVVIDNLERLWDAHAFNKGVDKNDLAAKAGVHRSMVYRIFQRKRQAPHKIIEAAAELLRVPVSLIRPDVYDFPMVKLEELPMVPKFTSFDELLQFSEDGVIPADCKFSSCAAAKDRFEKLRLDYPTDTMDELKVFRRKLGFCMLGLNQMTWFANRGDYLVVDVESKPMDADKITIWTWNRKTYTMGNVKTVGPKVSLCSPDLGGIELELDEAECIGYVRGVQFTDG